MSAPKLVVDAADLIEVIDVLEFFIELADLGVFDEALEERCGELYPPAELRRDLRRLSKKLGGGA
jgi:hypothetical protein